MAGLLDFQQPTTGMGGLLADPATTLFASLFGPGNGGANLARGIASAQAQAQSQKESQLKGLLYGAQIQNYQGDAALNQAKIGRMASDQNTIRSIFPGLGGQKPASANVGGSGELSGINPKDVSPDTIARLSGSEVAMLKSAGLDVTDIWKELRPKIQVSGGYAYDQNSVQPGFLPQVNTSANGQTSVIRPDGQGGVTVAAPNGAIPTYAAYKGLDAQTNAAFSPGRPVLGADGRQYGQSQLQEIGGGAPAAIPGGMGRTGAPAGPTNAGERNMASQVAGISMDIPTEIAKTNQLLQSGAIKDPKDQAAAQQYLQYLQSQSGGAPAAQAVPTSSAAGALDFSPQEKAAQEAEATRQKNTAAADVVRTSDSATKTRAATENLSNADRAMQLLNQGPTSSLVGNLVDKGMAAFGASNKGANIAAQLDIVSANMVKNVPRFEGPQSNIDVEGYKSAAGRVADRTLPIAQRLAAAEEVKRYEQKAIATGGGYKPAGTAGGATGAWDDKAPAKQLMDKLPTANSSNKGRQVRDTQTGQLLESNGMQWKPVK